MLNNSLATYNTLNKLLNNSYKILYDPHHSLFDKILQDTDLEIYFNTNTNIMDYNYDGYMTSNFIHHSSHRNNILLDKHITDIVFIHEWMSDRFKKEDKTIIKNNLFDCHKVILHESLKPSWQFLTNKTIFIDYGIPLVELEYTNNRKSILIFNLRKNQELTTLYQQIKNIYSDALMITDFADQGWAEIYRKISSYKIVIDEGCIINQIIAAYCGCYIITPHIHFDTNIAGYFNYSNFSNILELINSISQTYDIQTLDNQIKYIISKYRFNKFQDNIQILAQTLKQDIFLI